MLTTVQIINADRSIRMAHSHLPTHRLKIEDPVVDTQWLVNHHFRCGPIQLPDTKGPGGRLIEAGLGAGHMPAIRTQSYKTVSGRSLHGHPKDDLFAAIV